MNIEKAYDKLVLTNQEVQEALRKYVEEKTNRPVRGHVVINQKSADGFRGQGTYQPHTEGGAFCYLESGELVKVKE